MKKISWLTGALLLGFAFFISVFLVKPIGVSTQFSVASGIVHSIVDPDVIQKSDENSSGYSSSNAYYNKSGGSLAKSIKNPLNYDFIFVLSIPLGALAGYLIDKKRKASKNEEVDNSIEAKACNISSASTPGVSFLKSYLPTFLGGFLLLFGARMADGCTSGHMMSGMMQGSVSGYIFAASVFAAAIPAALIVKKINIRKVG
jgi:uncharacterized protein